MIGDNIKQIRITRGLTQAQLADRVNVSEKTVSSWEVNRTEPKSTLYDSIAKALSCDVGELVDGTKISPEDSFMLKKYHSLDDYGKRNVLAILNNEFDRCALQKENIYTA